MSHIHRLQIIFTLLCIGLSACAAPTEIPIPAPTITATQLPTASPALTSTPTSTPEPTAIPLDPEAWNEFGNVAIKNKNLAPYDKQLMVNPEHQKELAQKVFDLCNQYTMLSEMAFEIQERRNSSPLLDAKYQSFNEYMKLVIQPAIDQGKTIEGYHLVSHDPGGNKSPYIAMVQSLEQGFDPSTCSIRFDELTSIYPGSIKINLGVFQIGMNIIKHDDKYIRELIINPGYIRENRYKLFYANADTTVQENSISYSQLINTVYEAFNELTTIIPNSKEVEYKSQFVLGRYEKTEEARINLALPGSGGVEVYQNWMESSPIYLLPHTP